MPATVDGRNVKSIGNPVEGERTGEGDHVPTIDQPTTEPALRCRKLVEMDARSVLIETGCDLVLRLFDGDAIDVVDLFADGVVAESRGTAGEREVVGGDVDARAGITERARHHCFRQARDMIASDWRCLIALSHHDPAHVLEHLCAVRLATGRAHEHDAGLAARIFLQPDHLGLGVQRVARIDR